MIRLFWMPLAVTVVLAGCGTHSGRRAPIVDHSVPATVNETGRTATVNEAPARENSPHPSSPVRQESATQMERDWRPQVYRVQPGDTLYSIAFNFGFDYHELAELNNIPNPALIHVGQEIRLFPAAGAAVSANRSEGHSAAPDIKSQPLATKLPYSEQAVAQIENTPAHLESRASAATKPVAAGEAKPSQAEVVVTAGVAPGDVPVQWEMPASGKVVAGFSEAENRKGVDIAGTLGQPIYASAAGKVIFCGSGLRGYGRLLIIKHNSTYLSAYAHNDKLLVKEGQMVAKGQMIAQMGNTDADRVMLHFEIRMLGKPVDPAKYLVFPKS